MTNNNTKRMKLSVFNRFCIVIGRIIFWMLITILFCSISLFLFRRLLYIGVDKKIVLVLFVLSSFIIYRIWHYIKYSITILHIEGHTIIVRQKILRFLK